MPVALPEEPPEADARDRELAWLRQLLAQITEERDSLSDRLEEEWARATDALAQAARRGGVPAAVPPTSGAVTLTELADRAWAEAVAWEVGRPDLSGEVCTRHAADWDALHTLILAAGAWLERMDPAHPDLIGAPDRAGLIETDIVAAGVRLAAHLRPLSSPMNSQPGGPHASTLPDHPAAYAAGMFKDADLTEGPERA